MKLRAAESREDDELEPTHHSITAFSEGAARQCNARAYRCFELSFNGELFV